MKVGILTYFWAENPGTFLQAYSTLQACQKTFPEDQVELINYKHRRLFYKPSIAHIQNGYVWEGFRRFLIYRSFRKKHFVLSSEGITTRNSNDAWKFIRQQNYDLIIVGADTVLNLLKFHRRNGSVPVYWLASNLECSKVMCSSSAGALSFNDLDEYQRHICSQSINNFKMVGVRDQSTYNLIESLNIHDNMELQILPDPTILYEIDCSYIRKLLQKINFNISKPSVLLDLPRRFTMAPGIAEYYKSKGFKIVSFVPAKYADICLIDISPFEWAGVYKFVSLVITQRFHGTLFSLKTLTPVVTIITSESLLTKEGQSKYHGLLRQFDLLENVLIGSQIERAEDVTSHCDKIIKHFNKEKVKEKLTQQRDSYNKFYDEIRSVVSL